MWTPHSSLKFSLRAPHSALDKVSKNSKWNIQCCYCKKMMYHHSLGEVKISEKNKQSFITLDYSFWGRKGWWVSWDTFACLYFRVHVLISVKIIAMVLIILPADGTKFSFFQQLITALSGILQLPSISHLLFQCYANKE